MSSNAWQSDVTTPQVVSELRSECAALDSQGRKRTGAAVAWSLQRYLIFALLSCIPGAPQSDRCLRSLPVLCLMLDDFVGRK